MKAIGVRSEQDGRPLVWEEVQPPDCGMESVLVDIFAAGVNRADLMQRAGKYPAPPGASQILGLEMAGKVAAVGNGVEEWQPGDRVCALLPGGGYAEQAVVPFQMLMRIPEGWTFERAAALPEVFLTAYVNLFIEANLQPGETVLIHGGASGVGTAAIQLAREHGCQVLVTVGTDEKADRCRQLGADLAINYRRQDFLDPVMDFTSDRGVDVILDMVGAPYLDRNLHLLRGQGRLVFISFLGGGRAEINIAELMGRRLRLIGSVLRPRSLEEKVRIKEGFVEHFGPMLEDGRIGPIIDSIYPIQDVEAAHRHMSNNRNIGKIVLKVRETS